MSDCIFCKIASGEMGTELVMETDDCVVFHDINAKAPVHVLVVPKEHIETEDLSLEAQSGLGSKLLKTAVEAAGRLGVAEGGYRLVLNCGPDGGQEVPHVHLHLLGGKRLGGLAS